VSRLSLKRSRATISARWTTTATADRDSKYPRGTKSRITTVEVHTQRWDLMILPPAPVFFLDISTSWYAARSTWPGRQTQLESPITSQCPGAARPNRCTLHQPVDMRESNGENRDTTIGVRPVRDQIQSIAGPKRSRPRFNIRLRLLQVLNPIIMKLTNILSRSCTISAFAHLHGNGAALVRDVECYIDEGASRIFTTQQRSLSSPSADRSHANPRRPTYQFTVS